ncbi:MAG: hypothetical protein ACREDK_07135 [Thermoplasmata archaeon]
MGINDIVRSFLFGIFGGLTAILAAVTGPTYDNIVVPELAPGALFPALPPDPGGGASYLGQAADFSSYLLLHLVDPAIVLVALGVGVGYLLRAFLGPVGPKLDALVPRLVFAVILANFTLPVAGGILGLAGGVYPVIAGFDGGAWQHWVNLVGGGELAFSWDNGALAFVLSFVLFTLVLLLALLLGLRTALLAVLLVLLPAFTLLWPIPTLRPLARRAWLLFGELAFLPCAIVIPLELGVGSPTVILAVGYLTVAVSSPSLLSVAGSHLTSFGFPSAGGAVSSSTQRGLSLAALGVGSFASPLAEPARALERGRAAGGIAAAIGRAPFPASIPMVAADVLGRGTAHLAHYLPKKLHDLKVQRQHFEAFRALPKKCGVRHV